MNIKGYTTIVFFNLISLISLIFCTSLIGQTCDDNLINGTEFKLNCGGDCVPCISLYYQGSYNEQLELELFVSLPDYIWSEEEAAMGFYYVFNGDFENVCLEYPECQAFLLIAGSNTTTVNVTKYNQLGEEVAYGQLKVISFCRACIGPAIPDVVFECSTDPDSIFSVEALSVPLENGDYMVEFNFINGQPPYRIYDKNFQGFYDDELYSSQYYLGKLPEETILDLIVFDAINCEVQLDSINKNYGLEIIDTMVIDTMVIDTNVVDSVNLALFTNHANDNIFAELDIYPNISNSQFQLHFNLPVAERINICIYSSNGEKIHSLISDEYFSAGQHQISLEAKDVLEGLNFIAIEYRQNLIVEKILRRR